MALANHRVTALPSARALEQFLTTEEAAAALIGGTQTFPFTFDGSVLVVEGSNDGGVSWEAFRRTCIITAAGPHANIAALLAELNTAAQWDGGILPTQFVISNVGDKLVITHAVAGAADGLRISPHSDAIGSVSDESLLFGPNRAAFGTKYGSIGLLTVVDVFQDNSGQYVVVYTV